MYKGETRRWCQYTRELHSHSRILGSYLGIDVAIKEVLPSTEYDVSKYFEREWRLLKCVRILVPFLSRPHLTTHRTESLGIPTSSSTSDSLGLPILIAASLSFRNSSRTVIHFFLVILTSRSYSTRRQPPPIHPRQIQAAAVASPTLIRHRHCPCPRLPSCSQMHSSRPQRREPPCDREWSPQDHRLWLCPHCGTQ